MYLLFWPLHRTRNDVIHFSSRGEGVGGGGYESLQYCIVYVLLYLEIHSMCELVDKQEEITV